MVSEVAREGMGVVVVSTIEKLMLGLTQKQLLMMGQGTPWRDHCSSLAAGHGYLGQIDKRGSSGVDMRRLSIFKDCTTEPFGLGTRVSYDGGFKFPTERRSPWIHEIVPRYSLPCAAVSI